MNIIKLLIIKFLILFMRKYIFSLFITIVSTSLLVYFIFYLWQFDFNYPPLYGGGDGLLVFWFIKQISLYNQIYFSEFLSAPDTFYLYDYSIVAEEFHFFLIKFISLFNSNIFFVYNFYFLFKFILTSLISSLVFKKIGLNNMANFFCTVIFVFAPYAFTRFLGHYLLGIYFSVPLGFLLIFYSFNLNYSKFSLKKCDWIFIILSILVVSTAGIYYAYFTCFFLLTTQLMIFFNRPPCNNNIINLSPLIIILSIVSILFINALDIINYKLENGSNSFVGSRPVTESDLFGLKFIGLLSPVSNHIISSFAYIKNYWNSLPLTVENSMTSLGFISSLGFLILLIWPLLNINFFSEKKFEKISKNKLILFLGIKKENVKLLTFQSIISYVALIFANIGGFSFFIMFFFSNIRAYNRISIFIAFFSILTIGILLSSILKKNLKLKKNGLLAILLIITFLALGLFDQIGKRGPLQQLHPDFYSDQSFFKKIDKSLPKGSMVFQLPVMPFPEHPPMSKMLDYDHLRAYVHSENIHWSYPAMRGRNTLNWQIDITETPIITQIDQIYLNQWKNYHKNIPIEKIINNLSAYGFKGIYIDRFGFEDNGIAIEKALNEKLKSKPIISDNQRMSFYLLN